MKPTIFLTSLAIWLLAWLVPHSAQADVVAPTDSIIHFENNGAAYTAPVDFTVTCYGYSYQPGVDPQIASGTYVSSPVYSFSADCPGETECQIEEPYYLNYRHIDYCLLTGTSDNKQFIKNIGNRPYGSCTTKKARQQCTSTFDLTGSFTQAGDQSVLSSSTWPSAFGWAILLTLVTEILVIVGLRSVWKSLIPATVSVWYIVAVTAVASLLTLPYVWYVLPALFSTLHFPTTGFFWPTFFLKEIFVWIIETILFRLLLLSTWRKAVLVALACNAVSALVGLIL